MKKRVTDPITQYAKDVRAGRVMAGPFVRAECRRHLRDIRRSDLLWNVEAANSKINQYPDLYRHYKGKKFFGKKFDLLPWQKFCVGRVHGFFWADTPKNREEGIVGTRRFEKAYIETAKGSGKSPLGAGQAIDGLCLDGEPASDVFAAASSQDQARVIFNDAVELVKNSPILSNKLRIIGGDNPYQVTHDRSSSVFRLLSRTTGTKGSGPIPYRAVIDELHEHPDDSILATIEAGFKSRENPLLWIFTNSGQVKDSVCGREHTYATRVSCGEISDDRYFSYVCALDEKDDPLTDESCWLKVQPSLDVTISKAYMRKRAKEARNMPGKRGRILRLHFCVWDETPDSPLLTKDIIDSITDESLDEADYAGKSTSYVSVDFGPIDDLTAECRLYEDGFTEDGENRYVLFATGWAGDGSIAKREQDDDRPYSKWKELGWIRTLVGIRFKVKLFAQELIKLYARIGYEYLVFDLYGFGILKDEFDDAGVDNIPLKEHPQGFRVRKSTPLNMNDSIDAFETLVTDGRLRLAENGALRNHLLRVHVKEATTGRRMLVKPNRKEHIDLAVAAVMVCGAACNTGLKNEQDENAIKQKQFDDYLKDL